jgi:hypothetical protein
MSNEKEMKADYPNHKTALLSDSKIAENKNLRTVSIAPPLNSKSLKMNKKMKSN